MDKIKKEILENIISESTSFKDVIIKLGYDYENRTISRNIERQLHRYNFDIAHLIRHIIKDRYNKEKLISLVNSCDTFKDILLGLDLLPVSSNYTNLKQKLNKLNIDYSKIKGKVKIIWSEDFLRKTISESISHRDVLKKLDIVDAGGNFNTLKKYINLYNINIDHFKSDFIFREQIILEDILIENSDYSRKLLKERLYKTGLKERKCEKCSQGEYWNGEKISLILDHINGVRNDNRIENLRIVCPNCNATLDTHCGKNINKKTEETKILEKCECGNIKNKRSEMCIDCKNKKRRKIERPSYEQLLKDIKETNYCETGRKYNVSDNCIRKWIIQYEK